MTPSGTALHARLEAARQLSGATVNDLWWDYFSLGGRLSLTDLAHYLDGEGTVGLDDPDVVAHALNERFAGRGEDHPVPYLAEEPGTPSTTVDDARLAAGTVEFPGRLLRAASRAEPDRLATLVGEEARRAGLTEGVIFLVDHEQQVLTPLPGDHDHGPLEIDATMAGRAFRTEQPVVVARDDGEWTIWVPLLDGTERLGVFLVRSPTASERVLILLVDVAHAVAETVVSKTQYGDTLVLARRRQTMSLSAELRWPVLPPLTFTSSRTGIACVLEPAYDVAGDAFDYAANGDVLQFAIFDAMGHGLEATRLANMALAAYRSARRQGAGLVDLYAFVDRVIAEGFGPDRFVTGQFATLEADTGALRWLSAGHPYPLLLRSRTASELVVEPCVPMGLADGEVDVGAVPVREVSLEPGDRLLFFTDGVVEARSPGGERFGRDRLVDLTLRALADHQTLAETARRLVRSVQLHRDGSLQDDATIMFVAWD